MKTRLQTYRRMMTRLGLLKGRLKQQREQMTLYHMNKVSSTLKDVHDLIRRL